MNNYQDTLRKITAHDLGQKGVTTSLLLFPLRIETKFMYRNLDTTREPDRIYYAFVAIWGVIQKLKTKSPLKAKKIRELHEVLESLDIAYREDKALLTRLMKEVIPILPEDNTLHEEWEEIQKLVYHLQTIDRLKSSPATTFLQEFENKTNRLFTQAYTGSRRQSNTSLYSQTAPFKERSKHIHQCDKFLKTLEERIREIPAMTLKQRQKYYRLVNMCLDGERGSCRCASSYKDANLQVTTAKNNMWERIHSFSQTIKETDFDAIDHIISSKPYTEFRYTLLAYMLMHWEIQNKAIHQKPDKKTAKNKIEKIAKYTFIHTKDEVTWLKGLIDVTNKSLGLNLQRSILDINKKYTKKKRIRSTEKKYCLCVRIYPDELAVTQNLKGLNKEEYTLGRDFWLRYIFHNDEETRKSLWLAICDVFPPYRAAWIIKKTFPEDCYHMLCDKALEFRKVEDYIAEIDSNFLNAFPPTYVETDEKVFSVPVTELLPERFILQAEMKTHKKKVNTIWRYGRRLPKCLQVGLDMNSLEKAVNEKESQEHIHLAGKLRWMTDYDEAERMGMAITLPLDTFRYRRLKYKEIKKDAQGNRKVNSQHMDRRFEFQSIYIMGVNNENEDECSKILANLLQNHLYSNEGYDLLKVGTPTNILTNEEKDAYDTSTKKQIERYRNQAENCINPTTPSAGSDLKLLKELFTLDDSVLANVLDKSGNSNREIAKARIVNSAMIDYLNNSLVSIFKNGKNQRLNDFLSQDVLARGPFPPLRIGSQPYGILPICDFKYLKFEKNDPLCLVKDIVLLLINKWNNVADNLVNYNGDKTTITSNDYLHAIGCTPISASFWKRTTVKPDELILNAQAFRSYDCQDDGYFDDQTEKISRIAEQYVDGVNADTVKSLIEGYNEIPLRESKHFVNQLDEPISTLISNIKKKVANQLGKDVDDNEIRNLVVEFFDLFTHRLDAWLMGLLSNKLRSRMDKGQHRLGLGSFGWVFNLVEPNKNASAQQRSGEYILAPSANQAITGAVLRSAYKNSLVGGKPDYDMSVNLSSERVRNAIRIIEGIQNGLSVGTILGTDLERLIHDNWKQNDKSSELDCCIYPLRKKYPQITHMDQEDKTQKQEISDNDITVVNGSRLLEDYRKAGNKAGWLSSLKLFDENAAKKEPQLLKLIDCIDDEYDALTDVILSESVYKLTQGNTEAVEALTNALHNEKNVPLPDVTEIPIHSAQIDGYMVVSLPIDAIATTDGLIATAEPKVDQWLNQTLGGTDKMSITFINGDDYYCRNLAQLGISPSELVYLSANKSAFFNFLKLRFWQQTHIFAQIDTESSEFISFDEAEIAIDSLREILFDSRALKASDMVKETGLSDTSAYESLNDKWYHTFEQVQMLVNTMNSLLAEQAAIQNPTLSNYNHIAMPDDKLKDAVGTMIDCFAMGHTNALDSVREDMFVGDRTFISDTHYVTEAIKMQHTFYSSMQTMANNLTQALQEAQQIIKDEITCETAANAIKKLLISNMLIVPRFSPDANVPVEQLHHEQQKGFYLNVTPMTVEEQMHELAQVNDTLKDMEMVRLFQKWNFVDNAEIVPLQIPAMIGNRPEWLGTEVSSEEQVDDAYIYLLMHPENMPQKQGETMAGIVLAHWTERVPYSDQTAAISFNYDQPDAEAPQTLLLAVSTKDNDSCWSENMLLRTLKSAMHMVKCRSVDPDSLTADKWTAGIFPLVQPKDN